MSIWKRKKKKLEKTEKPEKEESVLKDFVDTLTYDKTEEEKKKTLTQMDADDKVVAVPTVPVGPQSSQVVTQAGPQQIVININIPAPLNKSEMNPEHKADMPKAPPLPKVPTITAKAPSAPKSPVIHTAVVQKSEEKPSLGEVIKSLPADKAMALLSKIKPGKNLKKNMTQGYAGQPPSNLMQMSQEPLKKDVVDMSKWKRRKDKKEDVKESTKPSVDTRSRDQKIKDALASQGKTDDGIHAGKAGGNFKGGRDYDIDKLNAEHTREPTKGELAAEELSRRSKGFVKKKKESELRSHLRERYKDIYGDIGDNIFDAVHGEHDTPLNKERIPGTKTMITHYGELPGGQHLVERRGHDYANNGHLLIDKTGKVTNLGRLPSIYHNEFQPYQHHVDDINEYNKDNLPDEEPTKVDSEDEHNLKERELVNQYQQRLHHEPPKALVNNIKKTKLYADITGKEQKKPEGEFDKREYKISRGPYNWGMEVRHIGTGDEFHYRTHEIEPDDTHPELAPLKQKYDLADKKFQEARQAADDAWSNKFEHPQGEKAGRKAHDVADKKAELARVKRAEAGANFYDKQKELTKKVIIPSEHGYRHKYGDDYQEKTKAHKEAAARFWHEHLKNHSKVKKEWGDIPFAANDEELARHKASAHLQPVKQHTDEEKANISTLLDKWAKRNKDKIKQLPEKSKLKQNLINILKESANKHAAKMDMSPEAQENRQKTLADVKRILQKESK